MLQLHKIKYRSNLALRSQFQLFNPLSYETLDFQHSQNTKHQLLSHPRAVMILVSAHVNFVQRMCAIPMPEYTFLTYCRSRPGKAHTRGNGKKQYQLLNTVTPVLQQIPKRKARRSKIQNSQLKNSELSSNSLGDLKKQIIEST